MCSFMSPSVWLFHKSSGSIRSLPIEAPQWDLRSSSLGLWSRHTPVESASLEDSRGSLRGVGTSEAHSSLLDSGRQIVKPRNAAVLAMVTAPVIQTLAVITLARVVKLDLAASADVNARERWRYNAHLAPR